MRQSRRSVITGVLIALVCIGCTSAAQSARASLGRGEWRLVEISGAAAIPTQMDARPTIRFSKDSAQVDGSGGCNSYGGEAAIKGSSLQVGQVISTKRACVDAAVNQQEARFFAALKTVDRYAIAADTLRLYHGSDVALRFVR